MEDPRDKYFYKLSKRDINQLSANELRDLLGYVTRMVDYVHHTKARRYWSEIKKKVETLLQSLGE
jgi:hypothetical protein